MMISDVLDSKGRGVASLLPEDSVATAIGVLADRGIGAVIVQDRWQKMQGLFSERDLVRLLAKHGAAVLSRPLQTVMTRAVITCRLQDRIEAALTTMTVHKVRHLPVLDQAQLVGIVSIGDLVKYRLDEKALEANVLLEIARLRVSPAEPPLPATHAG
ncbi:MAG: CBS domain-containing protein [Rhodospirillales bacterium]|jgi:CBS domain-containing protein|nr:CBS domain-containing protein [Rhodospirillales bacterium]